MVLSFYKNPDNKHFLDDKNILVENQRLNQIKIDESATYSRILKKITSKKLSKFQPDKKRVIARLSLPQNETRVRNIINRILSLKENQAKATLKQALFEFSMRHKDIQEIWTNNYEQVKPYLTDEASISPQRKLLIGAYFTMEYSVESVALFNPSVVIYPKQNDLKCDQTRAIFSFRATGEGHLSSIVFRSAMIDKSNNIFLEPISKFVGTPEIVLNPVYNKELFLAKLKDLGISDKLIEETLSHLNSDFSFNELKDLLLKLKNTGISEEIHRAIQKTLWLARSNYEIVFPPDQLITERVIFPVSPTESNGIEDARFVRFRNEDNSIVYFATYTAYDGVDILPQLIETKDFHHFKMITLNGKMAINKGMALFPRKINGKYAMIGRVDGENLFLMYSDNLHFWHEAVKIQEPQKYWEFMQIGNCGSPLETKEGWILLTHGVGPMRKYSIGAELLDLNDPSKIIGRLEEPLISPTEEEREGYVPNVVYSCGSIILNNELIIPYATSDSVSHIAIIPVEDLLKRILKG